MSYVADIVAAFGGTRPMALKIGRAVSTVDSWKARGSIPDAHKAEILKIARSEGLPLTELDFFPARVPETPNEEDAA